MVTAAAREDGFTGRRANPILLANRLLEANTIDVLPMPAVGGLEAVAGFAFVTLIRAHAGRSSPGNRPAIRPRYATGCTEALPGRQRWSASSLSSWSQR
jgi:hypothetical protein